MLFAGSLAAITVAELEKRVTNLEESTNKIIKNIEKTNEAINKMADQLYQAEEQDGQDEDTDDDDRRSRKKRRRR